MLKIADTSPAGCTEKGGFMLTDIGPVAQAQGSAVATLSFTPLSDREAYVTGITILAASALDQWNVTVGGRILATFNVDTVGNQNVTGSIGSNNPKLKDLFHWHEMQYGCRLTYPVPWGQTITVASVGGATANVTINYTEVQKGTCQKSDLNHYEGSNFRLPIWAYRTTAIAAAGELPFTTQVCPAWVPGIFIGTQVQAGYVVDIDALWPEAAGVNTYSGSSDAQSITNYVYAIINGQRLFTRSGTGGLNNTGTASATGSANTVYNGSGTYTHPFQEMMQVGEPILPKPIAISPGVTSTWGISTSGAYTGSPSYAKAYLLSLCDVAVLS